MEPAIEIKGLTKRYGNLTAVKNLDLKVERGTIHGFLGPNGAGKTTTIKVLVGLLRADHGAVRLLGRDIGNGDPSTRVRVGYMPELPKFPKHLKAYELLDIYGRLFGMEEKERREQIPLLLDMVGLKDRSMELIGKYSKGMQQRIGIAQALLNDPELVILDEPSLGLDPIGMVEVRGIIKNISREGMTIFMSSHLLNEVEQVCDHATIIDHGISIVSGTLRSLSDALSGLLEIEVEVTSLTDSIVEAMKALPQVSGFTRTGNKMHLESSAKEDIRPIVSREITDHGGRIIGMSTKGLGLEDIFVKLLARPGKGGAA